MSPDQIKKLRTLATRKGKSSRCNRILMLSDEVLALLDAVAERDKLLTAADAVSESITEPLQDEMDVLVSVPAMLLRNLRKAIP